MDNDEDDTEEDIIQKYLPIFLDLRKQALEEAHCSHSSEILISEDLSPSNSADNIESPPEPKKRKIDTDLDEYKALLDDDFPDSIFNEIPDEVKEKTESTQENDFLRIVKFPNISHLHRRRFFAAKRAKLKIPILFIKDVLNARNWTINSSTTSLSCDDLYENDYAIFSSIICRATIVGIELKSLRIFLDDGTGMLECCLDNDKFGENLENVAVDNSSIIHEFDKQTPAEYQGVNSPCLMRRGDLVQVIGNLRIYPRNKLLYVRRLCKELEVSLSRESVYVNFVKRLYLAYSKSKMYY
ncbi:hypothetical protein Trydic_g5265 [Trypoxylus dichotomus]